MVGVSIWERAWLKNSLSQLEGGWRGRGGFVYKASAFICKLPFSNLYGGHRLFWLGANGFLVCRAASFNCTPHAKCSVFKRSKQGHFLTCSNNCTLKEHYWATAHIANKVGCGRMSSFRERYVILGSCHLCGLLLYSNLSDLFSQNFVHVAGTLTWQSLAYNLIKLDTCYWSW